MMLSMVRDLTDKCTCCRIVADELKKSLMGKRYLIVLDDMWDGKAWDDLRFSFPDVGNRSRIVITTRLEEVAKQVKHHVDPYSLPFLKPDESEVVAEKGVSTGKLPSFTTRYQEEIGYYRQAPRQERAYSNNQQKLENMGSSHRNIQVK
ncbi:hypothetical protein FXO37_06974 [Capsicum annuum]|nr:hypothetical protein FXO37_06974 [Capsicum annuum]